MAKYCRRRTGCLTCRYRKKRCDEQFDELSLRCRSCTRMGLRCERIKLVEVFPPPNSLTLLLRPDLSAMSSSDRTSITERQVDSNDLSLTTNLELLSARDRAQGDFVSPFRLQNLDLGFGLDQTLHYYVTHLIPCRVVYHDEDTGFHMLISRAIVQPHIMDAVSAFALAHQIESYNIPISAAIHRHVLSHSGKVFHGFRNLLAKEPLDLETAATIAILLITTETANGRMTDWALHTAGATRILNAAKLTLNSNLNVYHRFLTRSLIYFDVLSAATQGTDPGLDQCFYDQELSSLVSDKVHSMIAANSALLAILADVCRLGSKLYKNGQDKIRIDLDALYETADKLESRLVIMASPDSQNVLVDILFEAYRNASLLFLYQTLNHWDLKGVSAGLRLSRYRIRLQQLIYHVSRIPANSPPASALLFPLFIGGVSSSDGADRNIIRTKISQLYLVLRFGNISCARKILEDLWALEHAQIGTLYWQHYLRETCQNVALF